MSGNDLLRPSIGTVDSPQRPLYSATAGYLTAFFGGPFAATGMAGLNAWRLGRLRTDALALAGGMAIAIGLVAFMGPAVVLAERAVTFWHPSVRGRGQ